MSTWNMPPGVTTNDIPGNEPSPPEEQSLNVHKIERLRDAMDGVERVLLVLSETIGLDIDGPFHSAISSLIGVAALATAESIGANEEAFDWFVFENHFGREARDCQWPGQEPVIIDSVGAFLKFEGLEG